MYYVSSPGTANNRKTDAQWALLYLLSNSADMPSRKKESLGGFIIENAGGNPGVSAGRRSWHCYSATSSPVPCSAFALSVDSRTGT